MSKTNCEDCIFAASDGNYQTGCHAGMPPKFETKGIQMREIEGKDGFHYLEIDTVCRMKRIDKWAKKNNVNDFWQAEDLAKRENQLHHSFIVYLRPDREYSPADIEKTLTSLKAQTLSPREIVLIERENHKTPTRVLADSELKWRRVTVYEDKPMDVILWEAIQKIDAYFYTLVEPGFEIPADFAATINSYFNDKFCQFQLLESADDSYNGVTCYIPTHYTFGTFEGIKTCCAEQNCSYMVKKINEVYPKWNCQK